MQFASALVEYLAAGIAALLWLRPLAQKILTFEIPINEASVVLVLPMAYVLGIYIDSTSSFVIRWIRHLHDEILILLRKFPLQNALKRIQNALKRIQDKCLGTPYSGTYDRTVPILSKSPELLAQTMLTYVGRDRIARCMALNSVLGILTVLVISPRNQALLGILVVALLWSLLLWFRLKRLSSKFKDQAIKTLQLEKQ
jgi:hypothetical protein